MEIRHIRGAKFGKLIRLRLSESDVMHIDRREILDKEPNVHKLLDEVYDKTIASKTALYAWDKGVVVEAPVKTVVRIQEIIKRDKGTVEIIVNPDLGRRIPKR